MCVFYLYRKWMDGYLMLSIFLYLKTFFWHCLALKTLLLCFQWDLKVKPKGGWLPHNHSWFYLKLKKIDVQLNSLKAHHEKTNKLAIFLSFAKIYMECKCWLHCASGKCSSSLDGAAAMKEVCGDCASLAFSSSMNTRGRGHKLPALWVESLCARVSPLLAV